MTRHTTLEAIRSKFPCTEGWKTLLRGLDKTEADTEPLALATVLEINGVDDAIWCLRSIQGYDKEIRLFAVACAREVQYLMTDSRSIKALDVAEAYANGSATENELKAAYTAAYTAARAAARAAAYTADYAANYAARAACYAADAACYADYAADAAHIAAHAVAYTARAAAKEKQKEIFLKFFG